MSSTRWRKTSPKLLNGSLRPSLSRLWAMSLDGEYAPSPRRWVRDQVELFERSGGTDGTTLLETGLPVVIVTNLGARTGKVRKTPLMRVEHDGRYAVVASQGGAPKHPVWYYNLKTNPKVELPDRQDRSEMVAKHLTGNERAQCGDRAVAAYPPDAAFQHTQARQDTVFLLQ